jgi:hypothetical protein
VFPILLAVYFIIRASKRPRLVTIIGAGILLGASCWLRSNALLLSPFFSIAVLFALKPDRRWRYSLALTAAALVVIAPLTIRNWVVYGHFIPISIGSGLNLMEGIAEYDKQRRFELPILDGDVIAKEIEWHERPDYAQSLYFPDGIQRDRDRFDRGMRVVSSNPGWFMGVMLRRMMFMVRYNDFWLANPSFNSPTAPSVLANPGFGHLLEVPNDTPPVWSRSMSEAIGESTFPAPEADVSANEESLEIVGDASDFGDQFVSAPIAVEHGNDYVLALDVQYAQGPLRVKVTTADPRNILASSRVPKRKKPKAARFVPGETDSKEPIQLRFASGDATEVRIVIANNKVTYAERTELDRPVVRLGRVDLFQVGATRYQWTRYPRLLIRGIQKNLYKTEWMWLMILSGVVVLALARRWQALSILFAIPAYYLTVHSALHTEYRYILAIHYFLFIVAGAAVYCAVTIVWRHVISNRLLQKSSD